MLLLALSPLVTWLTIILGIQYLIAIFALIKLFDSKPETPELIKWNIIIIFGILVGPILFLILNNKESKLTEKDLQAGKNSLQDELDQLESAIAEKEMPKAKVANVAKPKD